MRAGIKPGLARVQRLLEAIGHPERAYPIILVAGSNGKGTTAAALEAMLSALGLRTGLFSSPHLRSVRERFRVSQKIVTHNVLQEFVDLYKAPAQRIGATYFELTTACALWLFARRRVDWAILEVGLGGRWDACNSTDPVASVVTSIAREHSEYLGSTQAQIAVEKAQVARAGRPVLIGSVGASARRALRRELKAIGANPSWQGEDFALRGPTLTPRGGRITLSDEHGSLRISTSLLGEPSLRNVGLAAATCRRLWSCNLLQSAKSKLDSALAQGARAVSWPARLQVISRRPLIVVDVAHNGAAIAALVRDWRQIWPHRAPELVVGLLRDKSPTVIGRLLAGLSASVVVAEPLSPRALPAAQLARLWRRRFARLAVVPDIPGALELAATQAGREGAVLVTGSHYLVGPALDHFEIGL